MSGARRASKRDSLRAERSECLIRGSAVDEVIAALIALAGGMAGGLVGVGGGVLFVPALTIFLGFPRSRASRPRC